MRGQFPAGERFSDANSGGRGKRAAAQMMVGLTV